ncbi:MAG TPA: Uma2 family endonuclease [Bryobacteraceae bacterium]|jgi:Uma2 family endonuclease|nr:Uma2 family endonuclease [Bryobacteraceae bacterium]
MQLVSPLTIDDFEQLPDDLALNHELVDGALVDVPGNTLDHNYLRDLLISMLLPFVKEHKLGAVVSEQEYDFNGNAHGPDLTFVVPEKSKLFDREKRVQRFVPDLAIEIVSENDSFKKLVKKVDRYRKCGTKEAWILDIDSRKALVFSDALNAILDENGIFKSSLIPGFSIRLGDLFDQL